MFAVVGEVLLDLVQTAEGNAYRALPAGGPLNIAVGLEGLGHPTALMARFSSGAIGSQLRRYASDHGLDLSASVTTDQPATVAFACVDADGRASYEFYVHNGADWGWTAAELAALPAGIEAVHTGSLATALEPGAGRIATWWLALAAQGRVLLSFDPNIRPSLAGPRDDAVRRVEHLVALSHLVKASDEDLGWLYPDRDPVDAIGAWARLGPALAVLTRGPRGCRGVMADGSVVAVASPEVAVVDTIGAGDAFQSGLLSGLADAGRLDPRALASLTPYDARGALERAVTVAALTCRRAGANPPTRAEYAAFLEGG